jgi:hypothetical protein
VAAVVQIQTAHDSEATKMRAFLEISNFKWGYPGDQPISADSGSDGASAIFELLPRARWTFPAKLRWYLNLRYWKQFVAAVTIYSGVLMTWAYLVR